MARMLMFAFMLVAAVVSGSLACSCAFPAGHPTFCDGSYAAVIEVKDDGTVVDFTRTYKIRLLQIVYHNTPMSNGQIDRTKLVTGIYGAICGVRLSKGFYALTGGLGNPTGTPPKAIMSTGLCHKRVWIGTTVQARQEANSFQFPACPIIIDPPIIIEEIPVTEEIPVIPIEP